MRPIHRKLTKEKRVDMSGETMLTIIGNLTADPDVRSFKDGSTVANFTVASTPRTYDSKAGEWKDGDALFMSCSIWRDAADNVAESLHKGDRVIALGRLKQRSYENKDGIKVTVVEMEAEEVGPSLRYATTKVQRRKRNDSNEAPQKKAPAKKATKPQAEADDAEGDPWG